MTKISLFLSMFKSSTGNYDMGRVLAFKTMTVFSGVVLYSVCVLHKVPGWSDLGLGYGGVMAGCVAFIAGKEIAIAKAGSITDAA